MKRQTTPRVYSRSIDVAAREVGEDIFLINESMGTIRHLNASAAAIWRLLETPLTQNAIISVFCDAFPGTPSATIKRAVRDAISSLAAGRSIESRRTKGRC